MSHLSTLVIVILAACGNHLASAFVNRQAFHGVQSRSIIGLSMATEVATPTEVDNQEALTAKGLLKRDRYIATNRFAVRKDKQAKWEQRWATRKSRLATLDGFRYFHLMRRVKMNQDGTCTYDGGDTDETAFENYVSFTVWDKKSDFSAWRAGEAFKEAHGGTSIGAFLSTMVNTAFVLRGAPRPALYDGLLVKSTKPDSLPEIVDGWRSVDADGVSTLPAECFVAMGKYFVPPENAKEFEQAFANRESGLDEDVEGFVAYSLMRRDGQAKGHGMGKFDANEPSYVGVLIFKDRTTCEKFFQTKEKGVALNDSIMSKPSEKSFYEGVLVISQEQGA